jgi:DNA-binding XRE family transcriptional regulator
VWSGEIEHRAFRVCPARCAIHQTPKSITEVERNLNIKVEISLIVFSFFFPIITQGILVSLCEFSQAERVGMTILDERLKRLRLAKGLSRRQLETQAAIPHGIVSRLESGEQAYPSVPVAMRLAKVLGVSVDYLIGMYEGRDSRE